MGRALAWTAALLVVVSTLLVPTATSDASGQVPVTTIHKPLMGAPMVWVPKAVASGCTNAAGCGYIFGGRDATGILSPDIVMVDPAGSGPATFTTFPATMPKSKPMWGTAAVFDDQAKLVYLFGGQDSTGAEYNNAWCWNPAAPTAVASAMVVGANLGCGKSTGLNSAGLVGLFDLAHGMAAVWVGDDPACAAGCAYIFGGICTDTTTACTSGAYVSNAINRFDPSSGVMDFSVNFNLPMYDNRGWATAFLDPGHQRIYIWGGCTDVACTKFSKKLEYIDYADPTAGSGALSTSCFELVADPDCAAAGSAAWPPSAAGQVGTWAPTATTGFVAGGASSFTATVPTAGSMSTDIWRLNTTSAGVVWERTCTPLALGAGVFGGTYATGKTNVYFGGTYAKDATGAFENTLQSYDANKPVVAPCTVPTPTSTTSPPEPNVRTHDQPPQETPPPSTVPENSTDKEQGDKQTDPDSVRDGSDNCPYQANDNQADLDKDGVGDACDPDLDGDGICNPESYQYHSSVPRKKCHGSDNCPVKVNPDQLDTDRDGRGDVCDPDADSDGICNPASYPTHNSDPKKRCKGSDDCPTVSNADQADTDGNGVGDACEGGIVSISSGGDSNAADGAVPSVEPAYLAPPPEATSHGLDWLAILGFIGLGLLVLLVVVWIAARANKNEREP